MNRLILVGNGFDLAHGLKTSYQDFIDDFWEEQFKSFIREDYIYSEANDYFYFDLPNNEKIFNNNIKRYTQLKNFFEQKKIKINFENKFLKIISNKRSLQNWVDIENEYYQLLNRCTESNYLIDDLNEDFNIVKDLFIDYLNKIPKEASTIGKMENHICSQIKYIDLSSIYNDNLIDEILKKISTNLFGILNDNITANNIENDEERELILRIRDLIDKKTEKEIIKELLLSRQKSLSEILKLIPETILILNFNYTNVTDNYTDQFSGYGSGKNITINHIHGELNNSENPIIFGFGDDIDENYKRIENLNENKYMNFFKSIAYLQTDNYKKLLEFVDSEEYQVFIFGHSCGISDRTMLNTIFEHDNCKSVKPFFHKRPDGSDNYTDIVQNISRNFNDKKKFRDRVVNKMDCEPLT